MTIVSVSEGNLIVEVEGWDKLWSLHSRLVIPIQHVTGICADAKIAEGWWHGLRVGGTNLPGVITAHLLSSRKLDFLGCAPPGKGDRRRSEGRAI